MGDGATRIFRLFTHNGIQLCNWLRGVFSALAVVGIVGEDDIDDPFTQVFFVRIGVDGGKSFGLVIPTMPLPLLIYGWRNSVRLSPISETVSVVGLTLLHLGNFDSKPG